MASIVLEQFGGIAPRISAKRLADKFAQTADDVLFDDGGIRARPGEVNFGTLAQHVANGDVAIYDHNGEWQSASTFRQYARPPIAGDTKQRLCIVGGSYPEVYSKVDARTDRMGILAPTAAIVATPTSVPADPNALDAEDVSYVITFVDAYGAEGPPSPPTAPTTRTRDTDVALTSLPATPAGDYNFGAGAVTRIYRSNTGNAGTDFQFVKEVTIGTTSATDDVDNADLQEVLPSETWIAPPDDDTALYPNGPMTGIVELPNGMLAGFADNQLCFNEPFTYHAWPLQYRKEFEDPIVGIAAISSGLLVCTDAKAYVVAGAHPQSVTITKLEESHGCVAQESVVDLGRFAVYASAEGLVAVEGFTAALVTKGLFTRRQWNADYSPANIQAAQYENRYFAIYDGPNTDTGFIFDPENGDFTTFTLSAADADAIHYIPEDDETYINRGGQLVVFGSSSATDVETYTWKSKRFVMSRPVTFGVFRIEAEEESIEAIPATAVTVTIWADGAIVFGPTAVTVTSGFATERIAAPAQREREWEVQVSGTPRIQRVILAESPSELE
jgi:hypothetical protein